VEGIVRIAYSAFPLAAVPEMAECAAGLGKKLLGIASSIRDRKIAIIM